jgi:hypothetical protein
MWIPEKRFAPLSFIFKETTLFSYADVLAQILVAELIVLVHKALSLYGELIDGWLRPPDV